jgi:hypothetical protein
MDNNYIDKTPSEIWESWSPNQRSHFIADHHYFIFKKTIVNLSDKDYEVARKYTKLSYFDLPKSVSGVIDNHIKTGQYAKGGVTPFGREMANAKGDMYSTGGSMDKFARGGNVPYKEGKTVFYHTSDGMKSMEFNSDLAADAFLQRKEQWHRLRSFKRGGYLYEVSKSGESQDLKDRLMSAKNLKELKEQVVAKYGTTKGISVGRRSARTGAFYQVNFEGGGSTGGYAVKYSEKWDGSDWKDYAITCDTKDQAELIYEAIDDYKQGYIEKEDLDNTLESYESDMLPLSKKGAITERNGKPGIVSEFYGKWIPFYTPKMAKGGTTKKHKIEEYIELPEKFFPAARLEMKYNKNSAEGPIVIYGFDGNTMYENDATTLNRLSDNDDDETPQYVQDIAEFTLQAPEGALSGNTPGSIIRMKKGGSVSESISEFVDKQMEENMESIFDQIGMDMPKELDGEEYEQIMDEAREKAVEHYTKHPEKMAKGGGVTDKVVVDFTKALEQSGIAAKDSHKNKQFTETVKSIIEMSKKDYESYISKYPNEKVRMIYSEYNDWAQTAPKVEMAQGGTTKGFEYSIGGL